MWDNHQALHLLANALFLLAVLMAGYTVFPWVVSTPVFPLKRISVTSADKQGALLHVTQEQIAAVVHSQVNNDFLAIDLEEAGQAFRKLPWVRSASVRRQWPQGIEVTLEEHVAFARWGNAALVNRYGEVFNAASVDGQLPVFNGPIESAGEVLQQHITFSKLLLPLQQKISGITLSSRHAWRVHLDNGITLDLGRDQIEERLRRYVLVYEQSVAQFDYPVTHIDLRYPGGFAVRSPEMVKPQGKEPTKANLKKAA
jgi:cell division protein FtsQ